MSVGFEHLDLNALSKRGIKAGHTPGVLTDAVADLNLALVLALMRRIPEVQLFSALAYLSKRPIASWLKTT